MPTYSNWTVSGASIDYVPIGKPVNESVKLFNGKEQGSVPPTGNTSSNTGQYILAQDGTWIPQPSFTSGGSDAFEILRPSVFTPTYSAYTPNVTNSSYAYDVDTNHSTTFGEWEFFVQDKATSITDTLVFSSFGAKTQTWTSATINISRAYGYFNDGESSNTTTRATSVKVEFSTDNGSTWTTIVTDLSTSVPSIATTSSYTFTTTPTMGNIKVRLTVVRGGGGTIYNPLGFPKNIPGSTGDADLHIYDIWISGTYSGGSGNITCNNLTVTGDATFQNKIYDSTASAGTTGQVLKVAANGKVTWATDSAGTGTVTSITTTGANGVTISGGSTQTITTSGTFALALGNITPTSISTGTGSFSGDVEFAASIKSPNGSNSPIVISPDGTGDLHVNADSLRLGDNNADATIATNGTGDLILTTHEGSATQGIIRLYDGANGNITLTPNGTGQVQVGSDQVVTLTASQTLTNKTLSTSSTWNGNTIGVAYGGTGSTTLTSGSYVVGNGTSAVTLKTPTQVTADLDTFTYQIGATAGKKGLVPAAPAIGGSVVYLDQTGSWTTPSGGGTTTNALTIQSPLTGTSFNGSTAVTIGLGTVAVGNGGTGLTSLTAGYIPYGNGTSAFGSSANLFWDSTNSRLGLGITTPSATLHLQGSTPFIWIYNDDETDSGIKFGDTQNTGERFQVVYDSAVAALKFVHVNDAASTLTERLRINASGQLVLGNGDTSATPTTSTFRATDGSGTDIAGANLTIQGGRSTGTGTGGSITFNTAPASGTTGSSLNSPSERMRINQFGSVGIGTSSPSRIFHVTSAATAATCNFTSTATPAYSATAYNGGNARILLVGGNASGATTGIQFSQTGSFELYFGGVQESAGAAAFVWQGYSGAAYAERMRLTSAGNLGLGTTNPSSKLHIDGNFLRIDQGGANIGYFGNAGDLITGAPSGVAIRFNDNALRFACSSTQIAMFDTAGNFGLGTSSPSAKLHVAAGRIFLDQDYQLTWQNAGTNRARMYGDSGNNIVFENGSTNTERMRITSAGNLGIGTSSPSAPIHIQRSNDGTIGIFRGTSNAQLLLSVASGNLVYDASNGNATHIFQTNSTERMRIDSSGNVGIGGTASSGTRLYVVGSNTTSNTSIPIYANQVYGNTGVSSAALRLNLNDGAGGCYLYGYSGGAGFMHNAEYLAGTGWTARSTFASIMETTSSGFSFYLNSSLTAGNTFTPSEQMRLTSTGLGIGTSSPGYKLTVAGTSGSAVVSLLETGVRSWGIRAGGLATNTFDIADFTAGASRLSIDSSGNVGIGVTPSLPLHLYNSGAALAYFESTNANGPYVIWRSSGTSIGDVGSGKGISGSGNVTDFMIASRSTYPMILGTNSTERMRITSTEVKATVPFIGNSGTKGFGAVTTTTSTSTPTGGSSGDHYYIY